MKSQTIWTIKLHDAVANVIEALRTREGKSRPEFLASDPRVLAEFARIGEPLPTPGNVGRPRKEIVDPSPVPSPAAYIAQPPNVEWVSPGPVDTSALPWNQPD